MNGFGDPCESPLGQSSKSPETAVSCDTRKPGAASRRMIESYLCARDRFLKPGGKMFPNVGTICTLGARHTFSKLHADSAEQYGMRCSIRYSPFFRFASALGAAEQAAKLHHCSEDLSGD